jgi:hypothetical protein
MKPTTKRIVFILAALAFLLGAVAVYSTLISVAYGDASFLRAELVSKQEDLVRYQSTVQQVQELLGQFQNAGQVQDQVSMVLPNRPEAGYFADQVVGLSRINGLDLSGLSTNVNPLVPSRFDVVRNIGSITGEISMSGTYAGFKSFMRQLENNMLLMDTSEFRVERPTQGDVNELEYTLTIKSYYQTD